MDLLGATLSNVLIAAGGALAALQGESGPGVPVDVRGSEYRHAFSDIISVLRDAGLFGMSLLFILGLLTKRIVLGWTYSEVVKARDREKQRADALELLVARLTVATQRNTVVTEGLVLARHGQVSDPAAGGAP